MQVPEKTLSEQFASSNPKHSAWVSANAGSGKTHVLTQRVIRLMLAGNSPERILCLTFTKAAAANMKTRIFDTLADWTMLEPGALDLAIEKFTGDKPNSKLRKRARQLFALALDTPGGLKIQTIHAFCESLLHQFPLEANVPGHFETLQELEQLEMLDQAKSEVLGNQNADFARHYEALVPHAGDRAIEEALKCIIGLRQKFVAWIKDDVETAIDALYLELGVNPDESETSLKRNFLKGVQNRRDALMHLTQQAAESTKKTDLKLAEVLNGILSQPNDLDNFSALQGHLITKDGKPKADRSIISKDLINAVSGSLELLHDLAEGILNTHEKVNSLLLLKNSYHLFKIGEAVLGKYSTLKQKNGNVDFDDLIDKTVTLLNRADIRDWIRYRLDQGIDHLLVDEAQDTSPAQWEIVNAITEDFHVGEGARQLERTIFVVGDEKQSIFSFQGAEPNEFRKQERRLQEKAEAAGSIFHPGKLELSFRSTKDVLHAVDKVFSTEDNLRGLNQSGEAPVHDAIRSKHPGEVEIWPLYRQEKTEKSQSWLDPVDKKPLDDPASLLANRIADSISDLVGRPLPGMETPLKFGDILVLVRKRDRFITALTRVMKDRGLSVAGSDRLVLTDHIAVEDLLAIGQAAVTPADDLTLASVLKGALFDVDDETLFEFSHDRKGKSLFSRLADIAQDSNHSLSKTASRILSELEHIIRLGQSHGVFDFYSLILGKLGLRGTILGRLGMEAEDVLDAFLEQSLDFSNNRVGGLQSFITEISKAKPTIKREVELDRDEVRILTVHSSKGLEARLVYLVDHCGAAWSEKHRPPLMELEMQSGNSGFIWLSKSEQHVTATKLSVAAELEAAEAEYRRLLYVGMTRAADRLVVCGYHGVREPTSLHWHKMVESALVDSAEEMHDADGALAGWRWISEKLDAVTSSDADIDSVDEPIQPPGWLLETAPNERPLPRPLTPSGAHALIDTETLNDGPMNFSLNPADSSFALQRGALFHKLLEVMPDLPPESRNKICTEYLEKTCGHWPIEQRADVVKNVLSIIDSPDFSPLFQAGSRAEVPLAAQLEIRTGNMLVAGQIDRLVVTEDEVFIVDYKTNRAVPNDPEAVSDEYLSQLALYREMVSRIYKNHRVVSMLLWTHVPKLMAIPDPLLDRALELIKNK